MQKEKPPLTLALVQGQIVAEKGSQWTVATLGSLPANLPQRVDDMTQRVDDMSKVLRFHCAKQLVAVAKELVEWGLGLLPLKGNQRHDTAPGELTFFAF